MPELSEPFPRAFVEFSDPADPGQVFRCDLTWLTSRWSCIFGRGCPGIYAASPTTGCCTLGAHFTDAADENRVAQHVRRLTPAQWEKHATAADGGWVVTDPDGDRVTRVVDGACIFHNAANFPGGAGCALHHLAAATESSIVETKPDVCWQLPLRRSYRTVTCPDETEYLEITIGEYTRAGWGPGGADLDWYCSSNTEAHVASEPLYVSAAAELRALLGQPAYAQLVCHCDDFLTGRGMRHPATVAGATKA